VAVDLVGSLFGKSTLMRRSEDALTRIARRHDDPRPDRDRSTARRAQYKPLDVVLVKGQGVWVGTTRASATSTACRPTRR
jgi:hypothetical protein